MTWLLSTRLGRAMAALGGIIVTLLLAFAGGKREGRRDARADRLQDYQDTRRRMDDADVSRGDAADDLRWLRDRSQR
ncbi:hypothetical protein CDV50_18745 [Haematobacter massiliensis]|nr:hypothetical protein [Haematobacter massiliensis]OWJ69295.1 hypothetical protein CDV50_18745 [Haematobacter massiliensis]OWJ87411.1 hypothetical protein CDV51_06695 [Haematobacter massiliensis]QBJ24865.1 hypothetical protein HmaOT1_11800 [Haematobacter massiliensis]